MYAGKEAYQVVGDDRAGVLTVTVEILKQDDIGKTESYKNYEFPFVVQNERVLFTDFPMVR